MLSLPRTEERDCLHYTAPRMKNPPRKAFRVGTAGVASDTRCFLARVRGGIDCLQRRGGSVGWERGGTKNRLARRDEPPPEPGLI
jgi:hypothetical protein